MAAGMDSVLQGLDRERQAPIVLLKPKLRDGHHGHEAEICVDNSSSAFIRFAEEIGNSYCATFVTVFLSASRKYSSAVFTK